MNGRQKRNKISQLCLEDSTVVRNEEDIEREFRHYFVDLFTPREDVYMVEAVKAVDRVITKDMNTS